MYRTRRETQIQSGYS